MVCSVWVWFVARLDQSWAEGVWGCAGSWEKAELTQVGLGVQSTSFCLSRWLVTHQQDVSGFKCQVELFRISVKKVVFLKIYKIQLVNHGLWLAGKYCSPSALTFPEAFGFCPVDISFIPSGTAVLWHTSPSFLVPCVFPPPELGLQRFPWLFLLFSFFFSFFLSYKAAVERKKL